MIVLLLLGSRREHGASDALGTDGSSTTSTTTVVTATSAVPATVTSTPRPPIALPVGGDDPAPRLSIEPGLWTVAATFPAGASARVPVENVIEQVRVWDGVLDLAATEDLPAWRNLTGLTSECAEDERTPPCGPGIAILTLSSSMRPTALRLKSEFGMNVLTVLDVPGQFVHGYLDAAVESASPVALEFDPSEFGLEQPLRGPLLDSDPLCRPEGCDVAVAVETEGVLLKGGLQLSAGESDDVVGFHIDGAGRPFSVVELLIDRDKGAGVLAELRASAGGRRAYGLAFLPLEAALVRFELADGSPIWQRPLAG
ncbi:MAG TPA: hypothetical protein VH761_09710, partial [Ilumatobacteraceae bacterium]